MPALEYDREKAVEYAHKWAHSRNPAFYNFDNLGGDCTNFASQCIYVGSGRMNYKNTFGWYYTNLNSRSPSWTGVPYLYNFLIGNNGVGPYAHEAEIEEARPGDIVQLRFPGMDRFSHSPVIVAVNSPAPEGILIAAHTYDTDYRPLSTYTYAASRFVHIDGVR